jgi:hypothetical protein
MKSLAILTTLSLLLVVSANASPRGKKHLFILAGQSNMARLDPERVFQPMVEKTFGKEDVIIVKETESGQSILRWYKQWDPAKGGKVPVIRKTGKTPEIGDVYDRLVAKLKEATAGQDIETVTLCWMQGESDTYEPRCNIYKESFLGLMEQLYADLQRDDINVVIGRISDARMNKPHWVKIRKVQMELANEHDHWVWIDTDDCNDGPAKDGTTVFKNDVHYSDAGKTVFATRLAEQAIELATKAVGRN